MSPQRALALSLPVFFASGFAGLVYEVVWVRMLGLLFGSTTLAVSTVLAVYFSGLALGSVVFGRLADRTRRHPLRLYAAAEIAIGVLCLLSPLVFRLLDWAYVAAFTGARISFEAAAAVKFGFAFVALIGPATLLGGTLPLVVRGLSGAGDPAGAGTRVATLYGVNTLGAVAGTLATGFFLVPAIGVTGSILAAAALDFAAGAAAIVLSRRVARPVPAPQAAVIIRKTRAATPLFVAATAGFTSLALEVLFTRAIVTLAGSTVYAFTIILAVFLLGIGLGSFCLRRRVEWFAARPERLGAILGSTAVLGAASVHALALLPSARPALVAAIGYSFGVDVAIVTAFAALLVLPAAIFFGALLPAAARALAGGEETIGRATGLAYGVNTVSGILGSIAAGFFLLPVLGLVTALRAVAAAGALAGFGVAIAGGGRRGIPHAVPGAAAALVVLLASPALDRAALTNDIVRRDAKAANRPGRPRVLFYRDGMDATVSVLERGGHRSLYVNGRIQARNDLANRRLYSALALLPSFLCEEPANVLVIGLGSGITAGAASLSAPERLDCVEISADVVAGARFFGPENLSILEPGAVPGFRLVHDDARSFLLTSADRYDVIAANAFLPSDAGAGALYTVEHFESCRAHLSPGGVMSQWIPLFGLSSGDFATAVASFAAAFDDASLWIVGGEAILVGSKGPLAPRVEKVRAGMRAIDSKAPGLLAHLKLASAEQVLGFCVVAGDGLEAAFSLAPKNTDERPLLEYSAPRHVYGDHLERNLALVLEAAPRGVASPIADRLTDEGARRAVSAHFRATREGIRGRALDARGDAEGAIAAYERILAGEASDPIASETLADVFSRTAEAAVAAGNLALAADLAARAAAVDRTDERELDAAVALASAGATDDALAAMRRIVERSPEHLEARLNLGVLLANVGLHDEAEAELERAASLSAERAEALVALGRIRAARGDEARAESILEKALEIDPYDVDALRAMASILAGSPGTRTRALKLADRARELARSDEEREEIDALRASLRN